MGEELAMAQMGSLGSINSRGALAALALLALLCQGAAATRGVHPLEEAVLEAEDDLGEAGTTVLGSRAVAGKSDPAKETKDKAKDAKKISKRTKPRRTKQLRSKQ